MPTTIVCSKIYYYRKVYTLHDHPVLTPQSLTSRWQPSMPAERFIAELRIINPLPPWQPHQPVHVPMYFPTRLLPGATLHRWLTAVKVGQHYNIDPALIIAIASHENPYRDDYACGVKVAKGTNLHIQMDWCARIIIRVCRRRHVSPRPPTRRMLQAIGPIYCPTDPAWASQVWTLYKRAIGGRHHD